MSENRQDLPSKLAKARQQLKKAQTRVADLEAQLFEGQPNPASRLASEDRYRQRLEILHQIDLGIINATSIQEVVESALKHIRQIIPCQRADVMILDDTTGEALIFAMGFDSDTTLGQGVRVPSPPNGFEGYDARHIRVFDDFRPLQDTMPRARRLVNEGLLCALSALLMDREHPIGVLGLFADTPAFFTVEHQEIAAEIASQLTIAIHQMRLDEALTRHAAELEQRVVERTADLNDTKQRVEAILNNASDGILLVHTDMSIQQTNSSFNSLFACDPDDYFGKSLVTIVQAEDAGKATAIVETVVAKQQGKSIEIRTLRKDGTVFDAELSLGFIKHDGLVCTIRDITERKAQERQLRYYASLQESVVDAVIVTDTAFHIQTWNLGAERIYGWASDEVIGKSAPELLQIRHPFTQDRRSARQQFNEQRFLQQETIQRHKDGSDIFILGSATMLSDENGVPVGVISVNRDITERKAMERQLRYQASLQENVSDAVIVTDMEFRIQSWNKASERIYGWKADEVVNKATAEILHTEYPSTIDQQGVIQQLREQGWWQGEVNQHHKDGSIHHILGSVTLVKDESGMPFGVVSVNRDITERKAMERQLRYQASLQENVSDAVIVANMEFRIQSWNRAAERLYGWRADEVIGRMALELLGTQTTGGQDLQQVGQEVAASGQWQGEVIQHHQDGSVVSVQSSLNLLRDENGKPIGIVGIDRDITERKRAEDALNAKVEEEREFQGYLKTLHELTIELTQIDELDTFYKRVVEFGLERLGFERLALFLYDQKDGAALGTYGTDAHGKVVDERHIRFTPNPNAIMQRAFAKSERFYFDEHVQLYNDMEPVGFGWNAAAVLWNGTRSLGWFVADNLLRQTPASKPLLDILGLYALTVGTLLAQKQVQISLQESESRYRLLAENITDVIMRSNAASEYLYVSPSVQTVLGYDAQEFLGKSSVNNYIHPDDVSNIGQTRLSAREQNRASVRQIIRFRHKQGHYVWLETVGRAIRSEKTGEIDGFISSSRDISDRKRAEDALRESEARYRLLADTINDVVIRFSPKLEYLYVSPSSRTVLGYEPEELLGRADFGHIHAEDVPAIQGLIKRLVEHPSSAVITYRFRP